MKSKFYEGGLVNEEAIQTELTQKGKYRLIKIKKIGLGKVVRDKVDHNKGETIVIDPSSKKFGKAIRGKLIEEALELYEAKKRQDVIDEIADVTETLHSLAEAEGIEWSEVEKAKKKKKKKKGGFFLGKFWKPKVKNK